MTQALRLVPVEIDDQEIWISILIEMMRFKNDDKD